MIAIQKILGVMACSLWLCLSLSSVILAAENMRSDPCAHRKGGQPTLSKCDERTRIHTVEGHVLRVEFDNLIVRRTDGREVSLHINENTEMIGYVGPGEHIKATVNGQRHALSIRLAE